jgi:serine/threonine protein kinase
MTVGRIGRVEVLAELGRGAGSRVFRVRRAADALEYALKVVCASGRSGGKYLEQARRESRVGRVLDHPNLVKVYCLETDGGWFRRPRKARLLIEYAPGTRTDRLPPIEPGRLVRVFARVADALAHMHDRGVVHADLKPENLILDRGADVKVIDFGVAWVVGESKDRVQGTPAYMAPETALHKLVNERTDIFNLGATVYRLLTGRFTPRLAPGLAPGAASFARLLRPADDLAPGAPAELCDLIHRCVRYDPAERPASAAEVRDALTRLAAAHESQTIPD